MQNIEINDDFRAMMLKRYWESYGNAADSVSVILFDGTPPTKEEMDTFVANTTLHVDGWLYAGQLLTELTNAGFNQLLNIEYDNMTQRRLVTQTQMEFLFSQREETSFGLDDGKTATWFWMYQHPDSNPTGSVAYWNVVGTVGVVDSGADMELQDPVISTSRRHKMNDVTIQFDLQPLPPAEPETPPAE